MAQVVKARLANRRLRQSDLAACGLSPTKTGFLPDELNDCSSQYHAYMLALIMRFGDPCDDGLRAVVVRASQWLVGVYQQYGDPSPLGRGRFQVFGYAAMAAVASLAPQWNVLIDRQWLLGDLAEGHLRALETLQTRTGAHVWNLGTGQGYSVLEMVRAFEAASGKPVPYRVAPRRPGDIATCYADPAKAERELSWKARRGLDEMMRDAWRWQSMNPDGYR